MLIPFEKLVSIGFGIRRNAIQRSLNVSRNLNNSSNALSAHNQKQRLNQTRICLYIYS